MAKKDKPKNIVIRASAGSGKTFQLTRRFLWLISQGASLESILATTFSRKAAGEILDRILSDLAEAFENPDSLQSLRNSANLQWDRSDCLRMLRHLIRNLHHVHIRTLDSFFVRIAQSLSFELQLPPGWTILEEDQDETLRSLALSQVLQNADRTREWLNLLFKGEALRTISKQLQDLIREDYHRVFLEALPEAWERLRPRRTLGETELQNALQSLESYPIETLKPSLQKALTSDLERARNNQWAELLTKGIASKVAKGDCKYGQALIPEDLARLYEELIDHARSALLNTVVYQTKAIYDLFDDFHKRYDLLKRDTGAITFHDVTRYLRDYLCGNDAISDKVFVYRTGYELWHLLLDEFQDTSALQWQVLEGFARRICEHPKGSFFCVGDMKQSIYAWRGSEPGIFTYLESSLPDVCIQPLDVSWRSSPVVIKVVNQFFQGLSRSERFKTEQAVWGNAVQDWCAQFLPHRTMREKYPGYCCIVVKEAAENGEKDTLGENETESPSQGLGGEEPVLIKFVKEIYHSPFRPTIGILVRKNQAIEGIVAALRQEGFPVSQEGRNPVTASPAVQMILNVLRLVDHPGDTAAAWRIMMSPLKAWLDRESKTHLLDENQFFREFSCQLRRRLLNEGYRVVIRQLADDFASYVPAEEHFWLEKLIELASLYDNRPTARVRDFLNWLNHQEVSGVEEARIRVMTIHGAKGLQFDVVFLPDLEGAIGRSQGRLVYARSQPGGPIDWVCRGVNQELVEANVFPDEVRDAYVRFRHRWIKEDLSVLYVAMTRAIYGLYMFVAPKKSERASSTLSFSGLLCDVLTDKRPLTPGDIIFEEGDPHWVSCLGKRKDDDRPPSVTSRPPIRLRTPSRLQRSLPWMAPHQAEGQCAGAMDPLRWEPNEAFLTGTILHIWLSRIHWLDQGRLPNEEERRSILVQILGSEDRFNELDSLFQTILKSPAIRDLLSLQSYQQQDDEGRSTAAQIRPELQKPRWEVYLEQPFVVREQGVYTRGQFDRIVVLYDGNQIVGADIVDFKTDQVDPDAVDDRINFYRPQLELYQRAAAEWLHQPLSAISAHLAFVRSGTVHRVC